MPPIPKKDIPQKTSKKVTFEILDHTQTGVEASRFVSICMRAAGCTSVGMVIGYPYHGNTLEYIFKGVGLQIIKYYFFVRITVY